MTTPKVRTITLTGRQELNGKVRTYKPQPSWWRHRRRADGADAEAEMAGMNEQQRRN